MRSELEPKGFTDINVDCTSKTCTFKAPADADLTKILDKAAESGVKQFKDWSKN